MSLRSLLVSLLVLAFATAAVAANNRSAVSVAGSDANPCTTAAPCRTFNAAIAATVSGGEVIALDSAGYGTFIADRSITILAAPGVYAGITATGGGNGSAVLLTSGGSTVVLKNLILNNLGGVDAIDDGVTAQLYIDGCTVSGFTNGLMYTNSSNWSNGNLIDIQNSTFRNNGDALHLLAGQSFYFHVNVHNSLIVENTFGIVVGTSGFLRMTINRSRLVNNSNTAFFQQPTGGVSYLTEIESSIISGNNIGITSDGGAGVSYVRVSNSTITGQTGAAINAVNTGSILSRGNNTLEDNVSGTAFSGSYTAK